MKHGDFCHTEIPVTDFEKAKSFYTGLFGWKTDEAPGFPDYLLFHAGDGPGGGFPLVDEVHGHEKGAVLVHIKVDSINATLPKVKGLGGEQLTEKTAVAQWGWYANIRDPFGNVIALWESNPEAPPMEG